MRKHRWIPLSLTAMLYRKHSLKVQLLPLEVETLAKWTQLSVEDRRVLKPYLRRIDDRIVVTFEAIRKNYWRTQVKLHEANPLDPFAEGA